jgi:hypothetical protein
MLRIGIAASKMSKGGLLSYNLYVILIACLISLFVFFVCGFSILLVIFLISLIAHVLRPSSFNFGLWVHIFKICLIGLAVVLGTLNLVAIFKNIQFTKKKI